jgi:hypothetical protein
MTSTRASGFLLREKKVTKESAPLNPLIIPGFLPSTLRAALCAFKNVPDIFVVKMVLISRSAVTRSRRDPA